MVIWKLCSHSSAKIGFHFLNSDFWESVLKNLKLAWNRLRAQAVVLLSILFQPSGARITALCRCAQGDTLTVYGKRSETVRSLCKHANVRHTDIQTPVVCKGMTPYLHNAFVCLALFIAHMCLFFMCGTHMHGCWERPEKCVRSTNIAGTDVYFLTWVLKLTSVPWKIKYP